LARAWTGSSPVCSTLLGVFGRALRVTKSGARGP
jgi:hypothetical protein